MSLQYTKNKKISKRLARLDMQGIIMFTRIKYEDAQSSNIQEHAHEILKHTYDLRCIYRMRHLIQSPSITRKLFVV